MAEPMISVEPLLEAGAAFLKKLGTFVAETSKSGQSPLASFIDTDEKTGRSYLKIPMPDRKVVEGVINAIGPLLDGFKASAQSRRPEGHPKYPHRYLF